MILANDLGFIGAGRVGASFAKALTNCGLNPKVMIEKDLVKLDALKHFVRFEICSNELTEISPIDILIITVPDDEIEFVVNYISRYYEGKKLANHVYHTSGALTSEILTPLSHLSESIGSIHPIQSFSGEANDFEKYHGIYYGVEGDEKAIQKANQLIKLLHGNPVEISPKQKTAYHLACTIASNCLNVLVYAAIDILQTIKHDEKASFDIVYPLISTTLNNIKSEGCQQALTGPVSRGDLVTIKNHLRVLNTEFPQFKSAYEELAKIALTYKTVKQSLSEDKYKKLIDCFHKTETIYVKNEE